MSSALQPAMNFLQTDRSNHEIRSYTYLEVLEWMTKFRAACVEECAMRAAQEICNDPGELHENFELVPVRVAAVIRKHMR